MAHSRSAVYCINYLNNIKKKTKSNYNMIPGQQTSQQNVITQLLHKSYFKCMMDLNELMLSMFKSTSSANKLKYIPYSGSSLLDEYKFW